MKPSPALDSHRLDFTEAAYRSLLRRAKAEYRFVAYEDADPGARQILWRHDLDYSVHRALALARMEAEEGVPATYFVHLHNEFYHWGEKAVADRLREIRGLGHPLGLHFDPGYYLGRMRDGQDFEELLAREKGMLEAEFGPIRAFSIHNPDVGGNWLRFDADRIAGMVNAYGKAITGNFAYCSDSNGYWRFRRIADVLEAAEAPRLQVLTHPGWWQAEPMHPRERIFRALHGRFRAGLARYDAFLDRNGRSNGRGPSAALLPLEAADPEAFAFLDSLWNQGRLGTLFLELGRLAARDAAPAAAAEGGFAELRDALLRGETPPAARLEAACARLCNLLAAGRGENSPAAAAADPAGRRA